MTPDQLADAQHFADGAGTEARLIAALLEERAKLIRELRVAVEIATCHWNDGPCGECEDACRTIDPKYPQDWSAVARGEAEA